VDSPKFVRYPERRQFISMRMRARVLDEEGDPIESLPGRLRITKGSAQRVAESSSPRSRPGSVKDGQQGRALPPSRQRF
jgi:hypothetical protein